MEQVDVESVCRDSHRRCYNGQMETGTIGDGGQLETGTIGDGDSWRRGTIGESIPALDEQSFPTIDTAVLRGFIGAHHHPQHGDQTGNSG